MGRNGWKWVRIFQNGSKCVHLRLENFENKLKNLRLTNSAFRVGTARHPSVDRKRKKIGRGCMCLPDFQILGISIPAH